MSLNQVVGTVNKLMPSMAILPDLRKMLKSSESSIDDVVKLVKMDTALVSQVVRMSNSPYYGANSQSRSVDDAIVRIGFHEVYKIVAVILASPALSKKSVVYDIEPDQAWKESIYCAVTMQQLARAIKTDHDVAYTTGLLHSIGRAAINSFYTKNKAEAEKLKGKINTHEGETAAIGFNNAQVGAELLKKWNFSEDMTSPILHQFSPEEAGEYKKQACSLATAKLLIPYLDLEPGDIIEKCQPDESLLEGMDISEVELTDCLFEIKASLEGVEHLVGA